MHSFEDIGSKGHFSAKKGGVGGQKPPWGGQKKFLTKFFSLVIEVIHAKNQKKISNGLGCRTGTHRLTDEQTD